HPGRCEFANEGVAIFLDGHDGTVIVIHDLAAAHHWLRNTLNGASVHFAANHVITLSFGAGIAEREVRVVLFPPVDGTRVDLNGATCADFVAQFHKRRKECRLRTRAHLLRDVLALLARVRHRSVASFRLRRFSDMAGTMATHTRLSEAILRRNTPIRFAALMRRINRIALGVYADGAGSTHEASPFLIVKHVNRVADDSHELRVNVETL